MRLKNLGGNASWGQIAIKDPAGNVSFGAGSGAFTLTLAGIGGVGIDMTAATHDLTIGGAPSAMI